MICPVLLEYEGGALMRRTEVLQEVRKMRFEEAYRGWHKGRLTQCEAAELLGVCRGPIRVNVQNHAR